MKNKIYLISLLALFSCASYDKQNTHFNILLEPEDLKKDIRYVQKQLTKIHPDLHWYISKEALDAKFDSLIRSTNKALTPNEFYFKISPVVASVRQGHMQMIPLNILPADSLKKKYKKSKHPLHGFEYVYLQDKLYIVKNTSKKDSVIQIGTEVLTINDITPQSLYKKYRKTFTSDGYNVTGIPKFFARKVNSFYANELGLLDEAHLQLKCADSTFSYTAKRVFKQLRKKINEDLTRKSDTLRVKNDSLIKNNFLTVNEKFNRKKDREVEKLLNKKKSWFGYDEKSKTFSKEIIYPILNDRTVAILKIRDFSEGKEKVYDTIFTEFKENKVKNLIIDLRGNPGGRLSEIHRLSRYLNDSSYVFIQPATITKRTTFFNIFKGKSVATKILGAPFLGVYAIVRGVSVKRTNNGLLNLPLLSSKATKPHNLAYNGRIYVITDGMTFSAAAIISSHLKGRNRATFVGNETGGTFNGTVAGIMPVLKLPKSKLKLRVGLMTIKPNEQVNEEGYGVKPDIFIEPTIDEVVYMKDPELEWILNDIEEIKKEFY